MARVKTCANLAHNAWVATASAQVLMRARHVDKTVTAATATVLTVPVSHTLNVAEHRGGVSLVTQGKPPWENITIKLHVVFVVLVPAPRVVSQMWLGLLCDKLRLGSVVLFDVPPPVSRVLTGCASGKVAINETCIDDNDCCSGSRATLPEAKTAHLTCGQAHVS